MAEQDEKRRAVAVVLAPAGSEPVAVRAVSAERPWRVTAVSDPMLAMTEIALAERAEKARLAVEGNDKPTDDRSISFIVAHPQKWAQRHELLEAVTRYFPDVRLFAFDERGLHEAKTIRKAKSKVERVHRGARTERGAKTGRRPTSAPSADSAVSAISREEIEMLLGGESR